MQNDHQRHRTIPSPPSNWPVRIIIFRTRNTSTTRWNKNNMIFPVHFPPLFPTIPFSLHLSSPQIPTCSNLLKNLLKSILFNKTHHYYSHGNSDLEEGFVCLLLFQDITKYPLEKGEYVLSGTSFPANWRGIGREPILKRTVNHMRGSLPTQANYVTMWWTCRKQRWRWWRLLHDDDDCCWLMMIMESNDSDEDKTKAVTEKWRDGGRRRHCHSIVFVSSCHCYHTILAGNSRGVLILFPIYVIVRVHWEKKRGELHIQ